MELHVHLNGGLLPLVILLVMHPADPNWPEALRIKDNVPPIPHVANANWRPGGGSGLQARTLPELD